MASLKDTNAPSRYAAALALGRLEAPSKEAVAALRAALTDSEADVRVVAALALGTKLQEQDKVTSAVLAKALKDADPKVRIFVARCIAENSQTADQSVLAALRAALDDHEATVRTEAAITLAHLGKWDNQITDNLLSGLYNSSISVRFRAAQVLGRLPQPDRNVVLTLTGTLGDSLRPQLAAAVSLWRLGETNSGIFRTLAKALNASEPARRVYALNALKTLGQGEPTTRTALLRALKDEDLTVRAAATNALLYLLR